MSFSDLQRSPSNDAGRAFVFSVLGSAALTAFGTVALLMAETGIGDAILNLFTIIVSFLVATIVIGASAIVIGLPLTWTLARARLERPWVYPLAGFVSGALIVVFVPFLSGETRGSSAFEFLPFMLVGALPGCLCGMIWWVAYRRHRQGRDAGAGVFD